MKKTLYCVLFALVTFTITIAIVSCDPGGKRIASDNSTAVFGELGNDTISVAISLSPEPVSLECTNSMDVNASITIVYINGCKYYRLSGYRREAITHAGDCKKCHQRRIDEVKEALKEYRVSHNVVF